METYQKHEKNTSFPLRLFTEPKAQICLQIATKGDPYKFAISKDFKFFALACQAQNQVQIWSLETRMILQVFMLDEISFMYFQNDSKQFYYASRHSTKLNVVELETGKYHITIIEFGEILNDVSISPNENYFINIFKNTCTLWKKCRNIFEEEFTIYHYRHRLRCQSITSNKNLMIISTISYSWDWINYYWDFYNCLTKKKIKHSKTSSGDKISFLKQFNLVAILSQYKRVQTINVAGTKIMRTTKIGRGYVGCVMDNKLIIVSQENQDSEFQIFKILDLFSCSTQVVRRKSDNFQFLDNVLVVVSGWKKKTIQLTF